MNLMNHMIAMMTTTMIITPTIVTSDTATKTISTAVKQTIVKLNSTDAAQADIGTSSFSVQQHMHSVDELASRQTVGK